MGASILSICDLKTELSMRQLCDNLTSQKDCSVMFTSGMQLCGAFQIVLSFRQ